MSPCKLFYRLVLLLIVIPAFCGAAQAYDLTGTWTDDVGGRYRIRQVGNTIAWYDDRSPVATNVFSGTINGSTINGQWWDVPGGQLMGSGSLWLRIDSNDRLVKTGSNPDYGGTVITRAGSGSTSSGAAVCTPVGTWSWVENAIATIKADGTVNHNKGYTARWQPLGGNRYLVTWDNGAIDTLTLSPDGRAMDGTNNYGNTIHVTCASGSAPVPGTTPLCTPVGTWSWVGNATVSIKADGTVNHTAGYTARWQPLGGDRYRLTWNNGAIDTLTLSSDGRAMDGNNNYGNTIHVTCAGSVGGSPMSPGGTRDGSICSDSRTQAVMDEWLSRANPPDNARPGWNVRYDSWGRIVGRTPSSTITGLTQGVDTRLTRCEYLWSIASTLDSTNLGALQAYVTQRVR